MDEFYTDPKLAEEYRRQVELLAELEPVQIGCVVTADYVLDFLILYESLLESWRFYPFVVHAFVVEPEVRERLASLDLDRAQIHLLSGDAGTWATNASMKISLVERSGLDRCLVSDVDNVFVAETPELFLLLDRYDYVFVGAPSQIWLIQTSLWSFRRNERSIEFARSWHARAEQGALADASALPAALTEAGNGGLRVKVLARPQASSNSHWYASPYNVQANLRPFELTGDALGFREAQMGRAKVIHLGALRARGHRSLEERVAVMLDLYPGAAQFLPFYLTLANRAARRLGLDTIPKVNLYVRERLLEAGLPSHRNDLPEVLNRRGLVGAGAEVGVARGHFSEHILRVWNGERLISVDPWQAAGEEYVDVANVSQQQHDRHCQEALERLKPFGDRSEVWRMTSIEAARKVEDGALDFVYLDARHDYDSVRQDLEHWFGKVRPGGLIAGHDYVVGERPQGIYGVKSAVDEFFRPLGLQVRTTHLDRPWPSWVVQVPSSREEHVQLLNKMIGSERERLPTERDERAISDWQRMGRELLGLEQ